MGFGSPLHWILVLVIVLLIFGTKKIRNIGSDLGGAIKGFKDAMREEQATPKVEDQGGRTVDGEVTHKSKSQ